MDKKLLTFEEAEQSPTKWKKYLSQSKDRKKTESQKITKGLKESKKRFEKETSNPKNYPKK